MPIRHVLCAVDFSPLSERAAELAAQLARSQGAEVHLAHVVSAVSPAITVPEMGLAAIDAPVSLAEQVRDAEASLVRLGQRLGEPVMTHVVVGTPAAELVRLVGEAHIDLVVLGTHARTGIAHWLLGSVSSSVTRQVHVPVLIVPPGPEGPDVQTS